MELIDFCDDPYLSCCKAVAELKQLRERAHKDNTLLGFTAGIAPDRLREICEAERSGRLAVLPPLKEPDYPGLKAKYRVYKAKNGEPVEDCFVLRPHKDPAAVAALTAYAQATGNKQLSDDILRWIEPDERVVVLPCKVGTPYTGIRREVVPKKRGKGWETKSWLVNGEIKRFEITALVTEDGFDYFIGRSIDELGESWFIGENSHEAAEAALKEAKSK